MVAGVIVLVFVTGFVRVKGGKWPSEISTVDRVLIIGVVKE